jgi:LacI family fructose operon transcriptional repressor
VRLVLGGKAEQYRISAKTQRINDYIAENGLVVNHIARSLKLNKTETLGLVIPRLSNLFSPPWRKSSKPAAVRRGIS